ncbi:T9SS type A sorting domain-containing protein [Winogradskyella aurantiaca]|uniref:T9SS type A sorting domain-containing protein n=1 Tax=Winogradskyella aurantiaca TaxID=2219558 RepID=UPI000E1E1A47|nr:T9SS type A sorting domain-containing protein [Winogradskyella aurantiaca]
MLYQYSKKAHINTYFGAPIVSILMTIALLIPLQNTAQERGVMRQSIHTPACVYKFDPSKELRPRRDVPEEIKAKIANNETPCATFIVNYIGFGGNPEAQAAFQYAVDIWSHTIESSWEIRINATFEDLGGSSGGSITLGQAGTNGVFTDGVTAGVDPNLWYPQALYEKLTGEDTNGLTMDSVDISASFNSNAAVNWYYGTDANPPGGQRDFVSVVLHEIGHGLGFIGFASVDTNVNPFTGSVFLGARPGVYSSFIETGGGTAITDIADDSNAMYNELTGNDLFCNSPETVLANGGTPAKIYAPGSFSGGSSYSHWDEGTYEGDDDNNLMTPSYDGPNHNPGDITIAFFGDMGWGLCASLSTEEFVADNFGVSPVPFTNELKIRVPANARFDQLNLRIYDIMGKLIYEKTEAALDGIIDLTNLDGLESNMYFLQIENSNTNQIITKKIIKG